jgi:hypothetical protein
MTRTVETRLDGATLVVRIPMRFQRRGGRKRIVAPDGSEIARTTKPQPDGTLVKALARAWRWQRMLDEGLCTSVSEIGDAENISKSYVSRILRLALLAPDIIEAILAGRTDQALVLEKLERPLPASWEEQRRRLIARMGPLTRSHRAPRPRRWSIASYPGLCPCPHIQRDHAERRGGGRSVYSRRGGYSPICYDGATTRLCSRASWSNGSRRPRSALSISTYRGPALGAERATHHVEPPVQAGARLRELPSQTRNGIV